MIRLRTAILAAMGICAAATPALAQLGMGLVAAKRVTGPESDTITATGDTQYREIMLCVDDAPIQVQDITLRYRNGSAQTLRVRSRILAGRCGRVLTLTGRERIIATADLTYQPLPADGPRPNVQIYGR